MTSSQIALSPTIELNNGIEIPQIGLGLWQNKNERECHGSVTSAIAAGYRHFDSAQVYENEGFLGSAIANVCATKEISREDLFITTKLWNDNQSIDKAVESFELSLINLQMDYVDLFLVHFPVTLTRRTAWLKMQEIYSSGKAKAIGVSNYTIDHLEELLAECEIVPAINQVEIHVFLQQKELRQYCTEKNIVIEAYSPLAHGNGLDNEILNKIGANHGKTAAQIMIRWCAQNDMVVLPKSVSPERIAQNIDVFDFELSNSELSEIESLEKNFRTCWDPTNVS